MAVRTIQSWGVSGGSGIGSGNLVELAVGDSGAELALTTSFVTVDVSGGDTTILLPSGASTKHSVLIKRTGASGNTLTIDGNGDTIDGEASLEIDLENVALTLVKRAPGWSIW